MEISEKQMLYISVQLIPDKEPEKSTKVYSSPSIATSGSGFDSGYLDISDTDIPSQTVVDADIPTARNGIPCQQTNPPSASMEGREISANYVGLKGLDHPNTRLPYSELIPSQTWDDHETTRDQELIETGHIYSNVTRLNGASPSVSN